MMLGSIELGMLGPPLVAGLLVLASHVLLGRQVLARGIIFIDLAIAQIAGLGVIVATALGWEPHGLSMQAIALGSALLAALLLTWTERRLPEVQEALIGVLFILGATGGILLLADNPHGGEHLQELLVGQILWVTYASLLPTALVTLALIGLWIALGGRPQRLGFYALFACAVTVSVQLVGVYLVFASLIIPALASRPYPPTRQLAAGYATGMLGYALGLLASAWFDLPAGAIIVWAMAIIACLCHLLGSTLSRLARSQPA